MILLRSLRTRVTLLATIAALLMLAGAAFSMLKIQERQLFDAVDASLGETIDNVEAARDDVRFVRTSRGDSRGGDLRSEASGPDLVAAAVSLVEEVRDSALTLQLLGPDGSVLVASGDLRNIEAVIGRNDIVNQAAPLAQDGGFATVEVRDGDRFRIAATTVGAQTLVAGYSLRDVDRSLQGQSQTLLLVIPTLAAFMGLLVWVVLGQALRPVETIRREVMAIGPAELDRRVHEPTSSVEVQRLAQTMNDMLARLDASAARQRRFISDAAHELRSPLAGMRGQLEVNLKHPDAPERAEAELSVLQETKRMQHLVDDLLLLTRADHNSLTGMTGVIDLDDLVLEEATRLRTMTSLTIATDKVSGGQVHGDASQLRRVIRNLSDNAVRHARTTVTFTVGEHDRAVCITVADDGAGITPENAEHVFERFARLDEARDRDSGGSGLGLAISREIAHKHGGTLKLDPEPVPDGGARFILKLPAAT